jgi:ribokinase
MSARMPKIVIIGPCKVDMAVKCSDIPRAGVTVEGSEFSCVAGGAGFWSALQANLCDCQVHLVGKVGDDSLGGMVRKKLVDAGVNVDFLYTAQAMHTGVSITMVDEMGENNTCYSAGANRALNADEVECASSEQLISESDACFIHGDMPQDAVVAAIRMAKLCNTMVILEVPLSIGEGREFNVLDWPGEYFFADVLVPDLRGGFCAAEMTANHVRDLKFVGSELVGRGCKCVVIKMGHSGSYVVDRNEAVHVAGFGNEIVVDHSKCGPAFAGALAASCGAGDSVVKAVGFASAAGALAVGRFALDGRLPLKGDILELLLREQQ